jgi:hypothetical protein
MAIWFFQLVGPFAHWIDYFEETGEGLPFYKLIPQNKSMEREFVYGCHFAPQT